MVSPFAEIANFRAQARTVEPITPDRLRAGTPKTGPYYVFEAYFEAKSLGQVQTPAIRENEQVLKGYVTRWTGPANDALDLYANGSSIAWSEDLPLPSDFPVGIEGKFYFGELFSLPQKKGSSGDFRLLRLGGEYGRGGIGNIIELQAGTEIEVAIQYPV